MVSLLRRRFFSSKAVRHLTGASELSNMDILTEAQQYDLISVERSLDFGHFGAAVQVLLLQKILFDVTLLIFLSAFCWRLFRFFSRYFVWKRYVTFVFIGDISAYRSFPKSLKASLGL